MRNTLSNRQVTRAAVQDALAVLKAGPNAVAKHASVSAAALRVAHSVPSSSSSTLEIRVANKEPFTTPGTCTTGGKTKIITYLSVDDQS